MTSRRYTVVRGGRLLDISANAAQPADILIDGGAILEIGAPGLAAPDDAAEIDAMIDARDAARAAKDWAEADRLRDALTDMGIILEDGSGTTRWRRG